MMAVLYVFFDLYGDHRYLPVLTHSFPTRRSSDLLREGKMAKFYVQEFKCGNGNTTFYGEQTEHNHGKSNEFSKAAIDWLVKNAKWAKTAIESGKSTDRRSVV